ncbi:ribosome biogenesis protein BMS1 homolog [Onthophagus taurus]|uniref:ribosome biogenesis protein BMS1 homolog n=1 Tax=Onthophagus taurus TaxID=166361 RepID=UPI0039BE15E9
MNEEFNDKKKAHRKRLAGRKADKKDAKKKQQENLSDKQKNPKAFTFNSAIRAERRFRRKQDLNTKKQHVPLVDRTPIEPPPILIAVVGPPKVGKTTLINNLIKLFTRSPLTDIKGPVTIVTGKKRRVTLVECNNDINSMIDLAKVADLVLLLCDASFGFEMEVFEFLNICQVHGMPRIMGILTHLDMIKNNKALKNTKKVLKHRFWTEVYPGAKLFYLSGIIHGEYLRNEIKNLGRFISVMKFRPLTWRTNHSYLIIDRYEDITGLENVRQNPKCDRNVCLYGYVRGVPLNKNNCVHIPGFGDTKISEMSFLPDPCPLPETIKKRALVEKEKLIYAPFSGVGGIVYDKDAVYVELGGSHSHNKREGDETNHIFNNLIETKETLDVKMQHSELQLFTGSAGITAEDVEKEQEEEKVELEKLKESKELNEKEFEEVFDSGRIRRKVIFNTDNDDILDEDEENTGDDSDQNEEDDFDEDNSDDELNWKDNLQEKAKESYLNRLQSQRNLMKLVYGVFDKKLRTQMDEELNKNNDESDNDDEEIFKVVSHEQERLKSEKERLNIIESTLHKPWNIETIDYLQEDSKKLLVNRFVTGKWKESEDAEELLKLDDLKESDDELYGDFEDLETGEKFEGSKVNENEEINDEYDKDNNKLKRKREETENNDNKPEDSEKTRKEHLAKKLKLKEKFNSEYDNTDNNYYDELKLSAEKQAELNKSVFENLDDDLRVQIEGFRPGMYVRIELERVPSEFITNFDPTYPVIVGALNMGEENIGFVNVKLKKHRWYKKILKANDPVIVSLGWRRFQTLPLYSKLEDNLRLRYLKYTPQHLACNAHFWGPITPQGTGFLALQSCVANPEVVKQQGFRIAATGAVQELDKSVQIMKKLQLVGKPLKIHKNTAFITGMFNSALEVAKFEGAKIKTVSGIRGQIKKAENKPEGCFRATFEDKILISDLVLCRTWYKVQVEKFYSPLTSLLLPPDKKNAWKGVRTVGELKRAKGIKSDVNPDSLYTEIQREPKVFKPLVIPKKLQQSLPYKDKPKHDVKLGEKKKAFKRVAVVKEPHEEKVSNMLKMIRTAYEHKQERLKKETKERLEKHRKTIEALESKKQKKMQQKKKDVFRAKSKAQLKKNVD